MGENRIWLKKKNSRGHLYNYCESKHVVLPKLKEDFPDDRYLSKENIPRYPKCVFRSTKVCHVTDKTGLWGIFEDKGLRGKDNFLWWNLAVTDGDICRAAKWDQDQFECLKEYTTSLAFQKKSFYGNFCFTFNIGWLLHTYSVEFCNKTAPILRVYDTRLYKQEIVYSVLVHPKNITLYRQYRRLPVRSSHLCGYQKGRMSWRCQSPSDNYSMEDDYREYYVWDNVAVLFHMEPGWVLPISHRKLFGNLSVCEKVSGDPEMSTDEAHAEIKKIKCTYM